VTTLFKEKYPQGIVFQEIFLKKMPSSFFIKKISIKKSNGISLRKKDLKNNPLRVKKSALNVDLKVF